MWQSIKIIYRLLRPRERIHASLLLIVMIGAAGTEMLSLASIIPLLTLLSDPSVIEGDNLIGQVYQTGWFGSARSFFFFLTGLIFAGSVLRIAMLFVTQYAITRYALGLEHRWSVRLMRAYLHRPYEYFVANNSAQMGNFVLQEVGKAIGGTVSPLLTAISKIIVIGALMTLVVFSSPLVALVLVLSLIAIYGICALFILKPLQRRGALRVDASNRRHKYANEAFQGIKEAKLAQLEDAYSTRYHQATFDYIKHALFNAVSKLVPRNIAELTLIAAIFIALFVSISLNPNELANVIPTVGVIGLAGLRMLPAAQMVYDSMHDLFYNHKAVDELAIGLDREPPVSRVDAMPPLDFKHAIAVNNLHYRHPGADQDTIAGQQFEIERGQVIGITGETGAGKSTLLDLILGLRLPTAGQVLVDGQPLEGKHLRRWQSAIGYVPQHIYLIDDTIAANVALGEAIESIDMKRVVEACKLACLSSFIDGELPDTYQTLVGENGVRLSGGQRQRLGLARALYKQPRILVLDEATSALDNETERQVIDNIHSIGRDLTVIMVAHRLSTLDRCDFKVHLEKQT